MSRRETPMTLWYWEQIGGMLIEEFLVVPKINGQSRRLLDAVILPDEEKMRMPIGTRMNLDGKNVVIVQAKNRRLGMYLMGQTLFSALLIKKYFNPKYIQSIALCSDTDQVLHPMLEDHYNCKVVVCPPEVCRLIPDGKKE